jgi:hypothetical protein
MLANRVSDVDGHRARPVERGAVTSRPPSDYPCGERQAARQAGSAEAGTRHDAPAWTASYIDADGSFCQSPNSFPATSLQSENQPMLGTGIASPASPPRSRTRAEPASMSSTSK